jgi:hypothetical protein
MCNSSMFILLFMYSSSGVSRTLFTSVNMNQSAISEDMDLEMEAFANSTMGIARPLFLLVTAVGQGDPPVDRMTHQSSGAPVSAILALRGALLG